MTERAFPGAAATDVDDGPAFPRVAGSGLDLPPPRSSAPRPLNILLAANGKLHAILVTSVCYEIMFRYLRFFFQVPLSLFVFVLILRNLCRPTV
jgi:hypothetical protein